MANRDTVQQMIEAHTAPLLSKIQELTSNLARLIVTNNTTDYVEQTVDDQIRCEESLDVIKSLPVFNGKNSYVSWREAANNSMKLYSRGSRRYYAALTILRNKIIEEANDILTNHGTVLNLEAIVSRLDFAYADKRPIHLIEQELSIMRQGSSSLIDYYNEVNKKLTLLINKTIMTHGTNTPITHELNQKNRQYALRVFTTGLNPPLSNILFSLGPTDLPNALAKAQELEANNVRASFAMQFNRGNTNNSHRQQNNLRFPQRNQNFNFQNRNQFTPNRHFRQDPEPMEVDSSIKVFNRPRQQHPQRFNSQGYFNRNNFNRFQPRQNGYENPQQGIKRDHPSTQVSYQPQNKTQRINNISEEAFLESTPHSPTSSNPAEVGDDIGF